MELLNALGLNVKILVAQLINFSILFFVLYKFGITPMIKFLNDRKDLIEKGVVDAKKAQDMIVELEEKEKATIKKTKQEALAIIEKAKDEGDKKREKIIERAKVEIEEIIKQEKSKIQIEKTETVKAIKKEISDLVITSVEKILNKVMDDNKDKKLIKEIANELK